MRDFRFYNSNPLDHIENDCVCRAINLGTGLPYEVVQDKLELIGELFECEQLCVCCYAHLLEKVFGFTQRFANGKTVKQIAKEHPNNKVIIRIRGHLTCSVYGEIWDIWDCSNEEADVYWVVE